MAEVKPEIETFAKIKVCGIGGGGGAALNRMIADQIKGVDFIAINTDIQALHHSLAQTKIAIGKTITRGLGAGMNPDLGRKAAEENQNEIRTALNGADMVFLTCGLGGGTGTGAIPEVAKLAKDIGALTVAVVTKPFSFEGAQRRRLAEDGFKQLIEYVDTVITIPNDRVLQIIDKKTSLIEAFNIVDDVLRQGVQGISELITIPGLINVDFADVQAIMQNAGSALMGIGRASGENRAVEAAKQAVASPLLELSVDGAKGILFTITGGKDLGMHEVAEAAKVVTGSADEDAKIIFGAVVDENIKDEIRITVVATGFDHHDRRRSGAAVEVPVQNTWSPTSFLRGREDEAAKRSKSTAGFGTGFTSSPPVSSPVPPVSAPTPLRSRTSDAPLTQSSSTPVSSSRPSPLLHPSAQTTEEEEELEIPAFIRKKMM